MNIRQIVMLVCACISAQMLVAVVPLNPIGAGIYPEVILQAQVSATPAGGQMALADIATLQGDAPLILKTVTVSAAAAPKLAAECAAGPQKALIFWGEIGQTNKDIAGALHVGSTWLSFSKNDDGVTLDDQPLDVTRTWGGTIDSLQATADYIETHPAADVHTRWGGELKIGEFAGDISSAQAVDLLGDGRPSLYLASLAGDRVFRIKDDGTAEEITAQLGITAKSKLVTFGVFDNSGKLGITSWADGKLRIYAQADGKFATAPVEIAQDDCIGISTIPSGTVGQAVILVSRSEAKAPVIVSPGKATVTLTTVNNWVKSEATRCAVADFNGDGIIDIAQPFNKGVYFYQGNKDGTFQPGVNNSIVSLPKDLAALNIADIDANGLLDLIVTTRTGTIILRNAGNGSFSRVLRGLGGMSDADRLSLECSPIDYDNDGRIDLFIRYRGLLPQALINCGFSKFIQSGNLSLAGAESKDADGKVLAPAWKMACADDMKDEQGALAVGDFNGDSAEDIAIVGQPGNKVWLLKADNAGGKLALTVTLPATTAGQQVVVAYTGKRCLGARLIEPGKPAFFGIGNKGPITLQWTTPDGIAHSKKVVFLKSTRVELAAE
ncbi:MAG: VCBS repeat-containing protein [bacterium]